MFLHLGHSNMAGRTDTPVALRPFYFETHPRLWSFKEGWKLAKEPLSGDFLTRGRAGPGMAILRTALGMAEPDAVMVSIGHGQDGSRGGKCASYRRGGLLYDMIMGPARQLRGKVTFGAIISVLVLMDVFGDRQLLPRAHECHEAVARDMRADLGDPNIPFLMSDWKMEESGSLRPRSARRRRGTGAAPHRPEEHPPLRDHPHPHAPHVRQPPLRSDGLQALGRASVRSSSGRGRLETVDHRDPLNRHRIPAGRSYRARQRERVRGRGYWQGITRPAPPRAGGAPPLRIRRGPGHASPLPAARPTPE